MIDVHADVGFLQQAKRITAYERDMALKSMLYQVHRAMPTCRAETFEVRLHTNGHETQDEELQALLIA
jgi:hypothetical protein